MAYDIMRGTEDGKDWSCGAAADLPGSAKGYVPEKYWGPSEMEAKLQDIMSKPSGFMAAKPDREKAIEMLAKHMKSNKIGPKDMAAGVGSILFPAKEQQRLMAKLDDVRYDIRGMRDLIGAGVFSLAGALAFLGFAKVYKTAKGSRS